MKNERLDVIAVIDGQVEAYNARDLSRFMSYYIDNISVYAFPSEHRIDEISGSFFKDKYESLFAKSPNLHCEIVSRCIYGNIVVDQEKVTGVYGSETRETIAIYEVKDNKIHRVWFVKEPEK